MAIAAEEDHACGVGVFDETEQPRALGGHVAPAFPAVLVGHHLDRGHDEAQVGGGPELVLEPAPLLRPEHGLIRPVPGEIRAASSTIARVAGQRGAVGPGVEQDDLQTPALRPVKRGVIDPLPSAARRGLGHPEEVEERLLGDALERPLHPGVVLAVVMIVPGGEHRAGRLERLPAGLGSQRRVGGRELLPAGRHLEQVHVDVVAGEQEQVRLHANDRRPDVLVPVFASAGPEGHPGDDPWLHEVGGRGLVEGRCLVLDGGWSGGAGSKQQGDEREQSHRWRGVRHGRRAAAEEGQLRRPRAVRG